MEFKMVLQVSEFICLQKGSSIVQLTQFVPKSQLRISSFQEQELAQFKGLFLLLEEAYSSQSYNELMAKCNALGIGEVHSLIKPEMAYEKIKTYLVFLRCLLLAKSWGPGFGTYRLDLACFRVLQHLMLVLNLGYGAKWIAGMKKRMMLQIARKERKCFWSKSIGTGGRNEFLN